MYRNVILTLLLLSAIVIAIELARPKRAPPVPVDPGEPVFAAARAILERRIPELKLRGITVKQALDEIHRATGVLIDVNWAVLGAIGDGPVDIELHDVALGDALQFLLCLDRYDLAFYPYPQAEFDVVNGTVMIGTAVMTNPRSFPAGVMTLRIYDVRDLLTRFELGISIDGKSNEPR